MYVKLLNKKKRKSVKYSMLLAALLVANGAFAEGPPKPSELNNPIAVTLICIIAGLALVIGIMARMVVNATAIYRKKMKEEKQKTQQSSAATIITVLLLCFVSSSVLAQDKEVASAATQAVSTTISGLSKLSFYALISIIGLEIVILIALMYNLKVLLGIEPEKALKTTQALAGEESVTPQSALKKWWGKMNGLKPIKEEANIDLGHDYDGIRELDNRLPPWWLYGFYMTIVFACIYLWRYEIAHSAPSSKEEYRIEMAKAEAEKEEYLAKTANNIDESNAKFLTDPSDLEAGKKVFTTTCAVCHKADGGGMVGPNLTDDYWLHGGSVKEVFRTIKYGVPEKGMQSWKDNFSPKQIEQIASYVKSLHGSNPQGAKEPQGELYKEQATSAPAADSSKAGTK